jgi:hypothetical protein
VQADAKPNNGALVGFLSALILLVVGAFLTPLGKKLVDPQPAAPVQTTAVQPTPILAAPVQSAPVQPAPVQAAPESSLAETRPPMPVGVSAESLDGTWYLRAKTLDNIGTMLLKSQLIFHGPNVDIIEGEATLPGKWTLTGNTLNLRVESLGDAQLDAVLDSPLMANVIPIHRMAFTRKNENLFESGPIRGDRDSFKYELFRTRR